MMRFLMTVGFVCAAVMAVRASGPADEAKKLEGTWLVDSATHDGKAITDMKQAVFAGDKFTTKGTDGKEQNFTYKLDPSAKPKVLHLVPVKKEKNAAAGNAIYELDGDTLRLCLSPPDRRPTEFTDKGQVLIVLKRKK